MIRVISLLEGLYIGGRAHKAAPEYYTDDFFSPTEMEEIKSRMWRPGFSSPLIVDFGIEAPEGCSVHGSSTLITGPRKVAPVEVATPVDGIVQDEVELNPPVKKRRGRPPGKKRAA